MILTIDIGNAVITFCCVENSNRLCHFAIASDKNKTADEFAAVIRLLASQKGMELSAADGAVISSVVPQLTGVISLAAECCTGRKPLIVGPGVKTSLNIRMDAPTELGGDLVAAAVAAVERYPLPCIIIDLGTATAIGVINGSGCYIGGLICPGVSQSQYSLARSASQLPDVSLDRPKRVIGKNTKDSMRSGIIHGIAAMLDGIIDRVEAELGESAASIVATGISAEIILPCCRRTEIIRDEDLIMRGLWSIWHKNRE